MFSTVFVCVLAVCTFASSFPLGTLKDLPQPKPSTPKGVLLTLQKYYDSLALGVYDPETGNFTTLPARYPDFLKEAAGYFAGVNPSESRAYVASSGWLATLDTNSGKMISGAWWPRTAKLSTVFNPATGLEGLLQWSSPTTDVVIVNPYDGDTDTVASLPSDYRRTTFDTNAYVNDGLLFSAIDTGKGPSVITVNVKTGKVINNVQPSSGLRPCYVAPWKLLVASALTEPNSMGLITIDPTTGNTASLNITLFATNEFTPGPNAVDPESQTYFGTFSPYSDRDAFTFFQINLASRSVIRSRVFTPPIVDMAWLPAA